MTDYATRTNTSDYRERQLVYVTNVTNQEKLNVPIKFILNNSNFISAVFYTSCNSSDVDFN